MCTYLDGLNWFKRCLITPNSLWKHIPHSLFNQIGGLTFLLCDYNISKIPLKLCLLAWKMCYCHNFSLHTSFIWNKGNITASNKSLFLTNWFNRDIVTTQRGSPWKNGDLGPNAGKVTLIIKSKANRQKQNNNQERDTPDGNVVLVSRVHETECNRSDRKHSEIQTCTCECW